MPRRPGWAGLHALQHGAVCAYAPAAYELLIRPGPRMGEAARTLADCLAALPADALAPGAASTASTRNAAGAAASATR